MPGAQRSGPDRIGMKRLVCLDCQEPFFMPISRGQYPFHCSRPTCVKGRETRRKREAAQRRKAREARTRASRALLDRIWQNDRVMLHLDVILDAAEMVGDLAIADKREFQRSIVRLATATGVRDPREKAIVVAAHAMLQASTYRFSRDPSEVDEAEIEEVDHEVEVAAA